MDNNFLNLLFATILTTLIFFGWSYFDKKNSIKRENSKKQVIIQDHDEQKNLYQQKKAEYESDLRLKIESSTLTGSISLKGIRFDDLTLKHYKKTIEESSPFVDLLATNSEKSYFLEFGWISKNKDIILPNPNSIWKSNNEVLTPNTPIVLSWESPENIEFIVKISLDEYYLFKIDQLIKNNSNHTLQLSNYGLINTSRSDQENQSAMTILHEGFIGAINSSLEEYSYKKLHDSPNAKETFNNTKIDWIGITGKYWLTAFIPDKSLIYDANYQFANLLNKDRYQSDFISKPIQIDPNTEYKLTHRVFLGAKKVDLLDLYERQYDIKLFDRAIDFGWLYILTKPIFYALNLLYKYVGNFGISIMIFTVFIKLAMFSLSSKSHRAMKKIKELAPEIERIKTLYKDDKTKIHQETLALYKQKKVNPLSGCLPVILQIPVFFSLYKVLYITIEMRHAKFFGWIKDLSAQDPTNVFNLFGLLSFTPPNFLPHIGAWPIIMAITMFIQQRLNPKPADPTQALFMSFMPLIFLFMFSSFPAGLLIYWSWSNILSICQQLYLNKFAK